MSVKELIYGKAYSRYRIYDYALECFKNCDAISFEILSKDAPDDFMPVFEFLQSEGMCVINRHGITITEKGKTKLLRGGYTRMLLIERLTNLSIVIAIIGGIAGGLLYLLGK